MKIKKIRLINYKGYDDSGFIELSDRFNVVVGQNNTGKSAFLQGFRFNKIENHPHRNQKYAEGVPRPHQSRVEAIVQPDTADMRDAILKSRRNEFIFPVSGISPDDARTAFDTLISGDVTFPVKCNGGSEVTTLDGRPNAILGTSETSAYSATFSINLYDQSITYSNVSVNSDESVSDAVFVALTSSIYVFDAERYNIGRIPLEDTTVLAPNAINLPNVLAKLQKNSLAFGRYNRYVRDIFPSVASVTVSQTGQSVEILVYTTKTEPSDLAIRLLNSEPGGTQLPTNLKV